MSSLKGKLTLKSRKTLNERMMDAYNRGFSDGYETGIREYWDYVNDMEEMKQEARP